MAGSFPLEGRVALVTGSGRNIGRAIALALAEAGAAVVVNGHRDAAALDEVVGRIEAGGGRALPVLADVADPSEARRLVETAIGRFDRLDIVVCNVGIRRLQPFLEVSHADWNATLAVNLTSAFTIAQAALPGMVARRWGRLIHLSGTPIHTGRYAGKVPTIAAKAGLQGLAKGLADEFGPFGVTSNVVAPGVIDTVRDWAHYPTLDPERLRGELPVRRLGTVDDIAAACVYLAGESAGFVNGQTLHLNGGQVMF
ncbi:MAG: hypothetical protein RJA99_1013 [Pseudomonadota bacterium]|jgi:NAD(P)-dependent dehydrogenase (short-subunit alcohol dehydrogenase family)